MNSANSTNIDRDTQMLVEYSRQYPHYSILSLRKIIKEFDGDKGKLDEYLIKVNQRQTELKIVKTQSKISRGAIIQDYNKQKENVCDSPIKERKRHVSAPQHNVPRILVLPPNKSYNSCASLSPEIEIPDLALTPDSLNEGRSSYRHKKPDLQNIPFNDSKSYEHQFYRLWKSISHEIGTQNSDDLNSEIDEEYVRNQREAQKNLEDKIKELNNYRQFLSRFNQELISLRRDRMQLNFFVV